MFDNIIWIVGAGYMGKEFAKVLKGMNKQFITISRGDKLAKQFEESYNCKVVTGGLTNFLATNPAMPHSVILATGPESMCANAIELMNYGIKNILLEKPAGVDRAEIESIAAKAQATCSKLFVAYNRRFYQSVISAKEMIKEDGGVTSFEFDFTEWSHQISKIEGKLDIELNNWFYANSTHVIDMAFYLAGKPVDMHCIASGGLSWHKDGAQFSGCGKSSCGAVFAYHANWESAGRWSVEINTAKHKFIFKPLEKLQICDRGSVAVYMAEGVDYSFDTDYKPGLYHEVNAFLLSDSSILKTIEEQAADCAIYDKILGR